MSHVTQTVAASLLVMTLLPGCALLQRAMPDTMSDAQVLALLNTIDRTEIAGARLATQKAVTQPVRDYAERLLEEHAALLSKREAAVTHSRLPLDQPPLAAKLETENRKLLQRLSTTSGLDFDRAYIEAQMAKHDRALSLAHETRDAARDPRVIEQLRDAAPELQAHFARARSVRQQLALTPPRTPPGPQHAMESP